MTINSEDFKILKINVRINIERQKMYLSAWKSENNEFKC